jgi:hypothetical protein
MYEFLTSFDTFNIFFPGIAQSIFSFINCFLLFYRCGQPPLTGLRVDGLNNSSSAALLSQDVK